MNITIAIAIGAIVAAAMNIVANVITTRNNAIKKEKENINLLFGELLNILNHYQFSQIPMRVVDGDEENKEQLELMLKFSKYGEFEAIKNVKLYSFLSAQQVRNIHQLALRIRNTDILIDKVLNNFVDKQIDSIREINNRMNYVVDSAELLLVYISDENEVYKSLIENTKNIKRPEYRI